MPYCCLVCLTYPVHSEFMPGTSLGVCWLCGAKARCGVPVKLGYCSSRMRLVACSVSFSAHFWVL